MNLLRLSIALLFLTGAQRAFAGDTLAVSGLVKTPASFTVADLKTKCGSEIKQIEFASHGVKHKADAIPMLSVLRAAGLDTDLNASSNPATKHIQLRQAIIVRASDGYSVIFSLAELLATLGNGQAFVVLSQDGSDLASDGPTKLVVLSDQGPARSVRNLESLTVVDPTAPATQPN